MRNKTRTNRAVDEAEDQHEKHEGRVPVVGVDHRRDAEQHEDDRLTDGRQHLHEVLDGGARLG